MTVPHPDPTITAAFWLLVGYGLGRLGSWFERRRRIREQLIALRLANERRATDRKISPNDFQEPERRVLHELIANEAQR